MESGTSDIDVNRESSREGLGAAIGFLRRGSVSGEFHSQSQSEWDSLSKLQTGSFQMERPSDQGRPTQGCRSFLV